jgi:uncharacterized membrane protein
MAVNSKRYIILDLAKGILVILMILYHCASVASFSPKYFNYIDIITNKLWFISRAFLFLTGLICGLHYWPKLYEESFNIKKRIATRGLKLLSIFISCNIILFFFQENYLY